MPGGGARTFHFSTGGGGPGGFNFSNPENIFSEFLRGQGGGLGDDDDFGFGGFGMNGMPGGMPGGKGPRSRFSGGRRAPEPEVTVVEKPLAVTLEELFNGTTKKLKIKRKTYDQATGKQSTQDRILEVPIKKGLKAGSKIKFSDVGDQVEGGTQDLHFIVSEVQSPPLRSIVSHANILIETSYTLHPRRRRHQARH
jgi:DnaJ family protein B protein 4